MAQFIEFVTNHPLLSLAWVVIFLIIVGGWIKARFSAIRQVSPTELTMLVNRQDGIVVDIRGEDEFKKGHITGARNITASQISEQKLPGLEKQKDAPIIVSGLVVKISIHFSFPSISKLNSMPSDLPIQFFC